jgi:hypothetical protein
MALTVANLRMIVRDRILHGVLGFGLVMSSGAPLSSFSCVRCRKFRHALPPVFLSYCWW